MCGAGVYLSIAPWATETPKGNVEQKERTQ